MVSRILAGVVALMLGSLAVGWLFDPTTAAANLGMPLLDGIGRSTQVGDLTALFVSGTVLCLLGAIRQESTWLYSAALVLGSAAVFRTTAWAFHGAELATASIVAELAMTGMLVGSGVMMKGQKIS